jgi:hypothetical protein
VEEWVDVERRTLITEAWASAPYLQRLCLHTPLLLEAGQRYWVDVKTDSVIVEDAEGHRQSFSGHYGDPAERPR